MKLVKIVRQWLPIGWTSMKQLSPDGLARTFLAQDGMTGTLVTLALTRTSRIYLFDEAYARLRVSAGVPEAAY